MSRRRFKQSSASLALLVVLMAACGGQVLLDPEQLAGGADGVDGADGTTADDDDQGEHPAGPLHPDSLNLEEEPCFDHAEVITEDRVNIDLVFSCQPSNLALEPGRIVWGLEDGGFLRRILSIEVDGDRVHLTTEFASLAEAVTDVDFDESVDLEDEERGNSVDFSGQVLDEVDVQGGTSTVTVTRGVLDLSSQVNAKGSFGFLRLKSVTSRNKFTINLDMDVDYHSDGPVDRAQMVELKRFQQPFTFRIGPVRVRGVLHSTVNLGFSHTSDGPIDVSTSYTGSGVVEMGGTYTMPGSWSPHWNPQVQGSVVELEPEGTGDWQGRAYIYITGRVVVDGVEGGTSTYQLESNGSVTSDCETTTSQTAGYLVADTLMRLRIMGRSVDHTFPHLQETLDNKQSVIEHEEPPLGCGSPGSGLCEPTADLTCGGIVAGNTDTDPSAASQMDAYPCNVGNYDGPELVYRWVASTASTVSFGLLDPEPTVLNHDLLVLGGESGGCSAESCVAFGFNAV